MSNSRLNGAGRARARDALPALPQSTDWNSYCLPCGHWYFGRYLESCPRCDRSIFRWLRDCELRLLHSRTPIGRLY